MILVNQLVPYYCPDHMGFYYKSLDAIGSIRFDFNINVKNTKRISFIAQGAAHNVCVNCLIKLFKSK